jgi:hypothetical protein
MENEKNQKPPENYRINCICTKYLGKHLEKNADQKS